VVDDGVMQPVDGRPPFRIGEHSTAAAAVHGRGTSRVPQTVTVLDAVEPQPVTT
jgi:hypothetical protein